jgi:hypothetical protein
LVTRCPLFRTAAVSRTAAVRLPAVLNMLAIALPSALLCHANSLSMIGLTCSLLQYCDTGCYQVRNRETQALHERCRPAATCCKSPIQILLLFSQGVRRLTAGLCPGICQSQVHPAAGL